MQSEDPDASSRLSGEKSNVSIAHEWPLNSVYNDPVERSHMLTEDSTDPDAIKRPSGEKINMSINLTWPVSLLHSTPVVVSQSPIVRLSVKDATSQLFGEKITGDALFEEHSSVRIKVSVTASHNLIVLSHDLEAIS